MLAIEEPALGSARHGTALNNRKGKRNKTKRNEENKTVLQLYRVCTSEWVHIITTASMGIACCVLRVADV